MKYKTKVFIYRLCSFTLAVIFLVIFGVIVKFIIKPHYITPEYKQEVEQIKDIADAIVHKQEVDTSGYEISKDIRDTTSNTKDFDMIVRVSNEAIYAHIIYPVTISENNTLIINSKQAEVNVSIDKMERMELFIVVLFLAIYTVLKKWVYILIIKPKKD